MKKPDLKASRTFFRVILSAIFLSLLINLGVGILFNKQLFENLQQEVRPRVTSEDLDLTQSVFVDSILAIVQSYYVDQERVANDGLLKQAMRSLSLKPDLNITETGHTFEIRYKNDQDAHEVRWNQSMSYRALLSHFLGVAAFLDMKFKSEKGKIERRGAEVVLDAMLTALDAHSTLLSPASYRELKQGTEGAFGGLGVLVGIRDQLLTVIKPLPKSPALRAGIKRNDRILNINGKSTFGYSLDDLVEYMRGAPGTAVDVDLLKDGDLAPKVLTLKREIIKVESVTAKEVTTKDKHDFLVVEIESFSSRTSEEVLAAIKNFRKSHGGLLAGLVLDLRSNPGGLLEQAVGVADVFLKSGTIVMTKGRKQEVESAKPDRNQNDFPMVVLVNGESASASEIVAGALQDHGRALIVGEPSFGKGSVQTIFELPNEQALKLTIARYYTPLGRSIQNVGIVPDVWLQPVYNEVTNENLLGMFRYKNESFLKNHLEAVSQQQPGLSAKTFTQAAFKGFYLNGMTHKISLEEENKPDPELKAALGILDRASETYGELLPESARRATHWLALSSRELSQMMEQVNKETSDKLKQRFGIDWTASENGSAFLAENLQIKLDGPELLHIVQGAEVEVPWVLSNHGAEAIHRVSVYAGGNTRGVENNEILIGKIAAGETRKGKIRLKVPGYVDPGHVPLVLGFAIDAVAKYMTPSAMILDIRKKSLAKLSTDVSLVEETGANVNGILEAGETAKVRLRITNSSDVDARDLKATIQNLSGGQVIFPNQETKGRSLAPGESLDFLVDIKAGQQLFSKSIDLGVSLESSDLLEPIRRNVYVQSAPSSKKTSTVGAVAH